MTLRGKEDQLEPAQEDPSRPPVITTIGTNLPLVQLNTLLGLLIVTGRLVGGMKAPLEQTLVGPPALSPIHRTLGTKTRDSAKAKMLILFFFKLQLYPILSSSSVFDIFLLLLLSAHARLAILVVHWLCLGGALPDAC
jgi:hypothetical protein